MGLTSFLPQDTPTSILTILVLCILYSSTLAAYRLLLDPLSKFPGPRLAAFTRYYEFYYDVLKGGQYGNKIRELHKIYGPIIRISPYELHVNDPEFYEKIFRQDGRWDKYDFPTKALGLPGAAIGSTDHDMHRMRRSANNAFFSKQNILRLQPLIQGHVEKLRQRMRGFAETGEVLPLNCAYPAMTMDIISDYAIGRSTGNLDHKDFNRDLASCVKGFGRVWLVSKHIPAVLWLFQNIPASMIRRLDPMAGQWKNFVESIFAQIRNVKASIHNEDASSKSHRTIFHELFNHPTLPANEKTDVRLADEAANFVSAGTETTGHALGVITYYLCMNSDIHQRLRHELQAASLSDPPRIEELERLPYLYAVINEGLRFSYGVGTRLARIAPDRVLKYADWDIPSGTPVSMTNLHIAQNADIFPDPGKFDPERWIDPVKRRGLERYYQPFSRGTRNCLGINLAWAELFLVTAMTVLNFDFTLFETTTAEIECAYDDFIPGHKGKNGVRVLVRPAVSA